MACGTLDPICTKKNFITLPKPTKSDRESKHPTLPNGISLLTPSPTNHPWTAPWRPNLATRTLLDLKSRKTPKEGKEIKLWTNDIVLFFVCLCVPAFRNCVCNSRDPESFLWPDLVLQSRKQSVYRSKFSTNPPGQMIFSTCVFRNCFFVFLAFRTYSVYPNL